MATIFDVYCADVSDDGGHWDWHAALSTVETEICLFNRAYLLPLGDVDRRLDGWPENRISRQAPDRRGLGRRQASKFPGCSDDCVTNPSAQIYHEIFAHTCACFGVVWEIDRVGPR